jgi:outer membrane protein assembly factor BamB
VNAPGNKTGASNWLRSLPESILHSFAWLAGFFSLAVCAMMLYGHFHSANNDPWKSPQLLTLKEQLVARPKDEAIKEQIRTLDYEFRRQFRRRLAVNLSGRWLLLGGAVLAAIAAKNLADRNRALPRPQPARNGPDQPAVQSKSIWSVAAIAGVLMVALASVSMMVSSALPSVDSDWKKALPAKGPDEASVVKPPTPEEMRANWPGFRGWDGSGVSGFTNAPLSWDGGTGSNVAWKSPIPASGNSSPVLWGNRVFLTGAATNKHEVFSYDLTNGRLLWSHEVSHVPGSPPQEAEVGDTTGFAACTGATDGHNFYAIFANGDLAAVNFDGGIAWSKALGPIKNSYGHASSLALRDGVLIVQLDQGEGAKTFSKLLAFDAATGHAKWERSRPVPASWATPIIIEAGDKKEIIALGDPWVMAYSFADGSELWRAELMQNEVVPSPVFANGFVIVVSPSTKVVALRPEGEGEVTKSGVVWSAEDNVPDITSPVAAGGLVYVVNSGGGLTCYDGASGKKVWDHELKLDVQASPAILGDRLLVLSENGVAVQMEAGREFKELSRSALPDRFIASPAFADGTIVLRGETNLFCIRKGVPPSAGN